MAKVKHILEAEDAAIKLAILNRIEPTPENQKLVAEAFEEAAKAKDSMIEDVFGKKAAEKFRKLLNRDI
jgi:DNA-binding MarR family transcriptional regulator